MGSSAVALTILRVLAVVIALGVVGMGAWVKVIIHDIEVRGIVFLNLANLESGDDAAWLSFFGAAVNNQTRIWIAIACGSFTSISILLIILSQKINRMHMPTYVLLPLEFISTLSMAAAFGATLSLALKFPPSLNTNSSSELSSFATILPLSIAYAAASGTGTLILIITTLSFLIHTIHCARDSKACSFEPTASALGMSHGYQTVVPRTSRGPVPSIYDPRAPTPNFDTRTGDTEKGLAGAGAEMGRRDSAQSKAEESPRPMALGQAPEKAQLRPSRPWSEAPRR